MTTAEPPGSMDIGILFRVGIIAAGITVVVG
jgi:hypothetical protein